MKYRPRGVLSMDLLQARNKIEEIDKQMAALFEERMECAKDIAVYKKENNMPIFDAVREKHLIEKNSLYIKNDCLKEYYKEYMIAMMNISKDYQKEIIG